MMRFLELEVGLGSPVLGLVSGPDDGAPIVIHVHGYGGDHYSNAFVRAEHERLPELGITFASLSLPTSGFIVEQYSDTAVRYVGSAMVHPEESLEAIHRVVTHFFRHGRRVVLQGHSFGTNLVKELISHHQDLVAGAIFLSAADSFYLQNLFAANRAASSNACASNVAERYDCIVWNEFGISVQGRSYPIPIQQELFPRLIASSIFRAWSDPRLTTAKIPILFLRSRGDTISNGGRLADLSALKGTPHLTLREIEGESHSFADAIPQMIDEVLSWLRLSIPL
jgi:pimeloyl-ACP methyl ester carboxylesterase